MKADDPGVGGGSLEPLVDRLRSRAAHDGKFGLAGGAPPIVYDAKLLREAGERIQALEAENQELRDLVDMYRQLAPIRRGEEARERAEKAEAENATLRSQHAEELARMESFRRNQSDGYALLKERYEKAEAALTQIRQQIEHLDRRSMWWERYVEGVRAYVEVVEWSVVRDILQESK